MRKADGDATTSGALLLSLSSWYWDVARDLVWTGPGMAGLTEVEQQAWLTRRRDEDAVPVAAWLRELLHGDSPEAEAFAETVRTAPLHSESRAIVHTRSGAQWYSLRAVVAESVDGRATKVYGLAFDATAYRHAEAELAFRAEILERVGTAEPLPSILEALCESLEVRLDGWAGVLIHDRDAGHLWHVTRPSARMPRSRSSLHSMVVADGNGASGTAAARAEDVFIADFRAHPYTAEYAEASDDEETVAGWAHPLVSADGVVVGVLSLYRREASLPTPEQVAVLHRYGRLATLAIERAALNDELLRSANVDHHTKLPNRARFLEQVNARLAEEPAGLSVLVFDLNGLDTVMAGRRFLDVDAILGEAARRVLAHAGHGAVVAALDTGSFAVATTGSQAEVLALGERILRALDEPIVVQGGVFYVSGAGGISRTSHGDAFGLVREATGALHAARAEGSGRLRVYDDALHLRIADRIQREADLRRALEADEFVLVYQPTLNAQTQAYEHVEALVRWQHPTRGLVPPEEFISLAEQTGLIVPLGDTVLRLAIEQAKKWAGRFGRMRIAVNVSAVQLANPGFADDFLAKIAAGGASPTMFAVEVTESGLIQTLDTARASLHKLLAASIGIAVDDFGTGQSSLARLGEIPASGLKIDRSFIKRLTTDPVAPRIVRAIIDVAQAHGLRVVAEGVEDASTYAAVRDLGCQYIQGYYLSRPLSAEDTEAFLAQRLPASSGGGPAPR